MKDEMEIKVLERYDLFQNDGIHLDGLRKTMKEFNLYIQLPSWELNPGIFQVYFENFTGKAINIYMAVTKLSIRPFVNFIRKSIFTFTVEN
jgi:hypothetical protein